MRSLLFRVFVSFWAIIIITITVAGTLGYIYAERARATLENFEVSEAMLEASTALQTEGREGLVSWLGSLPEITGSAIYIVDERGKDLLSRKLPIPLRIAMRRFGKGLGRLPRGGDRTNLKPARPFTQLLGPDAEVYTFFLLPQRSGLLRRLPNYGGLGLVIIALLVSAAISYLLARTISRPIQLVRESANAVAAGDLQTRTARKVRRRQDDIGLLARDFDHMTAELQSAWQRQQELTANVSHELRSPLARLRVALELAARKTGDLAELERIAIETQRLDELIGQLLEYSRLDAMAGEVAELLDLSDLVQSVIEDVLYEFEDSGVTIAFVAPSNVTVTAQTQSLRSAIENVVRNAAQHSPRPGKVTIHLDEEHDRISLAVQDGGGGVRDTDLDRIFEPFYRSPSSSAAVGTGLGLAIAARAIALSGGAVTARNNEDGLRVEISLPKLSSAN